MKNWNEKFIQGLVKAGKIKGYAITKTKKKLRYRDNGKEKNAPLPKQKPKGITWLEMNLAYWCNEKSVRLEQEYKFCQDRKWRFDFAIPALKIAIEYEGGIFMERSGHNSAAGIQRDIDKYTKAQGMGWKVIRTTAANYTTAIETLTQLYLPKD